MAPTRNVAQVAIRTTARSRSSARIADEPADQLARRRRQRLARSCRAIRLEARGDDRGRRRVAGPAARARATAEHREAPDERCRRRRRRRRAAGPPSPIRSPAPSGPSSDPALSAMPDTTLAAVRSSGRGDDLGHERRVDRPGQGDERRGRPSRGRRRRAAARRPARATAVAAISDGLGRVGRRAGRGRAGTGRQAPATAGARTTDGASSTKTTMPGLARRRRGRRRRRSPRPRSTTRRTRRRR